MNAHKLIDKLVLAFDRKGKIISVSTEENYSLKLKKMFKRYKLKETTVEELELKRKYYQLKKEYKNRGKPPGIRNEIQELGERLKNVSVPVVEFTSKVDLVKYLAEKYKGLSK